MTKPEYKFDDNAWTKIDGIISYLFANGQTNLAVDATIVRDSLMAQAEEIVELQKKNKKK